MQINNMNPNYINRLQIKTTFNDENVSVNRNNDKIDADKLNKKDLNTAAAALSLTGGDLFKAKGIYTKQDVAPVAQSLKPEKVNALQDFDLSPVKKADEITATKAMDMTNNVTPVNNDKIVISDPEMDNFLRNAFKVFDLNE